MKKSLFTGLIISVMAVATVVTVSLASVNAESVYDEYSEEVILEDYEYTLEEMLVLAIEDEYLAKAMYEAIIEEFGEVRPFSRIVIAEQTHIDLLLPLFETYGITVPEADVDSVVVPESITSALSTGIEAEEANIAMYEKFLAQDNLPDDVRAAFEALLNASTNHLNAFSKDHYSFAGQDMARQIRNMFQKRNAEGKGNLNRSRGNSGSSQGYNGDCPNA